MLTVETLAEIREDGTLKARAPASAPKGRRRVVIVIDDAEMPGRTLREKTPRRRRLPDLSEFRASLNCRPYPGNSVVDMRDEER